MEDANSMPQRREIPQKARRNADAQEDTKRNSDANRRILIKAAAAGCKLKIQPGKETARSSKKAKDMHGAPANR